MSHKHSQPDNLGLFLHDYYTCVYLSPDLYLPKGDKKGKNFSMVLPSPLTYRQASTCYTERRNTEREQRQVVDLADLAEKGRDRYNHKRFIYRLLARHGCLPVWLVADK